MYVGKDGIVCPCHEPVIVKVKVFPGPKPPPRLHYRRIERDLLKQLDQDSLINLAASMQYFMLPCLD